MAKKVKIHEMSVEELTAKRAELKKEYFDLRCQAVVGVEHGDQGERNRL